MTVPAEIMAFEGAARRFVAWAEGVPPRLDDDLFQALLVTAELYAAGVALPGADPQEDAPDRYVDKNEHVATYERLRQLPLQYYGEVFDPTRVPPEEPSVGDLADDLLDVYCDVKAGLQHYDAGHVVQAVWHWKFTWSVHWGRHATSALRALHCFTTNPSGVSGRENR